LSTRELEARFDDPSAPLSFQIFDNEDGLTDTADVPGWDNARQGPDGRLWFSTNNGIFSLDPSRLRRNDVPPPVVIRSVVANGVRHEFSPSLDLGSGVRNLEIDFTAPSLSRPSRVQFRYRLAGVDEDWVDPGTRRQAIYTNLSPGEYQFQVMAANEDGVWNPEAAVLELSVPPTFIQSRLFLVLCIAAAGLLLWLLYKLRLRQVAGRIRERLEARQRERERIARELHDTLLQSVQGLILKVQAASEDIPDERRRGPRSCAHWMRRIRSLLRAATASGACVRPSMRGDWQMRYRRRQNGLSAARRRIGRSRSKARHVP
jgi:hypothetical protein